MNDITSSYSEGKLVIYIQRDVDHHVASSLRMEIDRLIAGSSPSSVILDFDAVDFMDSSGVGLIMGRYKKMEELGGEILIRGLNPRCRKLIELSGITKIVNISEE